MPLSFDNTEITFRYRNDKELKRAHFLFNSMSSSFLTKVGITLIQVGLKWHLPIKGLIRNTLFSQFCGGENLEECAKTAAGLDPYHVNVALDYGVEGKETEKEYDLAVPEFIKAINYAATQPNIPFIPVKVTGFASFELLEKVDAGESLSKEETAAWENVQVRIDQICAAAAKKNMIILIDAEVSWIQKAVDFLANEMMTQYNKLSPTVFNTFQLYRHDRLSFLKESFKKAQDNGYILGAKLVRGAYMEKERARARQKDYPSPIQADKEGCDHDFDEATTFCLYHLNQISVFIGTHNEASCLKAVNIMNVEEIPHNHPHVWFAQLYGMSDNITFNLANAQYRAAKYLPYGPIEDVIPYLLRRAEENSSVSKQSGRDLSLIKKEMKRRGIHRF